MRVLVAGSVKSGKVKAEDREQFEAACRQIGKALAGSDCTLVLQTEKESSADVHVFEGFVSVASHGQLVVVCSDSGDTPFLDRRQDASGKILFERREGDWSEVGLQAVMLADIVVAIGGAFGVQLASQSARALEKPVLAIPGFGGTSDELFKRFLSDYKSVPEGGKELSTLQEPWSEEGHARSAVRLAKSLQKNNPFAIWSLKPLLAIFASTVALLLVWLILIQVTLGHFLNNFIGIMAVSVLMGSILHHGLRQFTNPAIKFKAGEMLIRFIVGLIIGFGLTLAFMLGGLGITGSIEFMEGGTPKDLFRIGAIFSSIGLAAGFLLEASETKMRTWLQTFMDE